MAARNAHKRDQLTRTEHELLELVAEGMTNKEIAARRWVVEETVKFHLANILRKLGVPNRTAAAAFFVAERASPKATMRFGTAVACPRCGVQLELAAPALANLDQSSVQTTIPRDGTPLSSKA